MSKLSDRVRPDVEAAPWVVEEIKRLEDALEILHPNFQLGEVESGDVIFPAPFSKKDTTGLCTIRDAVSFMFEQKSDVCEMCFWHKGREWNVELRILRSVKSNRVT